MRNVSDQSNAYLIGGSRGVSGVTIEIPFEISESLQKFEWRIH